MIQLFIKNGVREWTIEAGPITILKSAHSDWYLLTRTIEDFFVNKQSQVEIDEDTQPINKKDWECLFIPFDAHLSLDKLTTKSPLKPLLEELTDQLVLSPYFYQLQELWGDLKEELLFQNEKVDKYGLVVGLNDFSTDELKKFIYFSTVNQYMTPIKYKMMLLNLFVNQSPEKKRLVIIELPELYANQIEFNQLIEKVIHYAARGIRFIVVSSKNIEGNCNYLYEDIIVNEAMIQNMKNKIINDLPFSCNDELFELGKTLVINSVDNSEKIEDLISKEAKTNEALATVIYVISTYIGLRLNIDISMFSKNITSFIQTN